METLLPAVDARPDRADAAFAVEDVVAVVLRARGAGMVGQDAQRACRPAARAASPRAAPQRDDAVLLVGIGDDEVSGRAAPARSQTTP